MAYRISSPSAELDYEYARIAHDHPDWTSAQVKMAQQGQMAGAPDNGLLEGFGLSPNYRITGADPQEDPPYSSVNPRPNANPPRNRFGEAVALQDHKAAIAEKQTILKQMDKLDPTDPEDANQLERLQSRLDSVGQSLQQPYGNTTSAPQPQNQPSHPTGEVAPIYRPGGPAAFRRLSGGGSVYFGPNPGGVQDEPPAGTTSELSNVPPSAAPAAPQLPGQAVSTDGFMPVTQLQFPIVQQGGGNPATEVPPNPSPKQVDKRIKFQKQLNDLPTDSPDYVKEAINRRIATLDNSVTNAPSGFTFGPSPAADNPNWTPDQNRLAASGFMRGAASNQPPQPPDSAVNYLKQNPHLADEFDTKYGQGAAAQILGQ